MPINYRIDYFITHQSVAAGDALNRSDFRVFKIKTNIFSFLVIRHGFQRCSYAGNFIFFFTSNGVSLVLLTLSWEIGAVKNFFLFRLGGLQLLGLENIDLIRVENTLKIW